MIRRILKIGLFAVLAPVCFAQAGIKNLQDLAPMAGCWERRDDSKKALVSEVWMRPSGDAMLGIGRTQKNGKTTAWEFMRIEERQDGLYFVSRPRENTEDTSFKLIRSTKDEVVFENPSHDFPQRVIYKIEAQTMTGRIEGNSKGKLLGIDFPMVRVPCT